MAYTFADAILASGNNYRVEQLIPTVLPQRNWLFVDHFMTDKGQEEEVRGGLNHVWNINYKLGSSTQWVKPGSVRNPTLANFQVQATLPLVDTYFQVSYLEHEMDINRTGTARDQAIRLNDIIKNRRAMEMLGHFVELEAKFLSLPVVTGDNLTPYGLPYHLVPITAAQIAAGTGEGAFQGIHASGFSSWCGIDVATYTGLKSYNAAWDGTGATAIKITDENKRRLALMFKRLNFQAPLNFNDVKLPAYSKFLITTDETIYMELGAAAQNQNDQLGNDTMTMRGVKMGVRLGQSTNGAVILNGLPVTPCDTLDGATYTGDTAGAITGAHPLMMINKDCLKIVKRQGKFMKKRPPASDAVHTPDQTVEYFDSEFNVKVSDRQKVGGLISWVE